MERQVAVLSDSTGETGEALAKALLAQFPSVTFRTQRFSDISSTEDIDKAMACLSKEAIIVTSLVVKEWIEYTKRKCEEMDMLHLDLLDNYIDKIASLIDEVPKREPRLSRGLDELYFDRIEALEFAIKYDDGKDPRGMLLADIVLIGVSRTSKTPLSMFLAMKNYKVANLPLVPGSRIPQELYRVDPTKIVGLIIDPDKLNRIRTERLRELGIVTESTYADDKKINEELEFALALMKELKCDVIDVSEQTIEETAIQIMQKHPRSKLGQSS